MYFMSGTHPKGGLLHGLKDPTFGFYNLAHSDVTVFHSFKPKVEKIFMNSNE